jgi:hypothetical protein
MGKAMGSNDRAQAIAFLGEIAAAMGATVLQTDEQWGGGHLRCADAAGRTFWLEHYTRDGAHVKISGLWPAREDGGHAIITPRDCGAIGYRDSPPQARASCDRDPEAIARDFMRRFMPAFGPIWDKCDQSRVERERGTALEIEAATALAKEFGGSIRDGGHGGGATSVFLRSVGAVRVSVYGDRLCVRIERSLDGLTMAQARVILALLEDKGASDGTS